MSLLSFLKKPNVMLILGALGFVGSSVLTAKATVKFIRTRDALNRETTREDIKWANNTTLGKNYHQMASLGDLNFRLHGEPIGIGDDDYGYDVETYMHTPFEYTISDTYKKLKMEVK